MIVDLEKDTFYGQLRRILVVEVPQAKPMLLAIVQSIKLDKRAGDGTITFFKEPLGPLYAVDLNTVEGVVGRIWDRERWAIVDRAPKSHT